MYLEAGHEMTLPFHCLSTHHLCPQRQQIIATELLSFPSSCKSVIAHSSASNWWREVFSRKISTCFWVVFSLTSMLRILQGSVNIQLCVWGSLKTCSWNLAHCAEYIDFLGMKQPIILQLACIWPLNIFIHRCVWAILTFTFPFLR